MSIIKDKNSNTVVTYDITLEQMAMLIANDLGVNVDDITVYYDIREVGGDFLDRYPGTNTVTNIRVTYKKK